MKKSKKTLLVGCLSVIAVIVLLCAIGIGFLIFVVISVVKQTNEIQTIMANVEEKVDQVEKIPYIATPETTITKEQYQKFTLINKEVNSVLSKMDYIEKNKEIYNNEFYIENAGYLESMRAMKDYLKLCSDAQSSCLDILLNHNMSSQEYIDLQFLTWMSMARAERTKTQGDESIWTDYLKKHHNLNLSDDSTETRRYLEDTIEMQFPLYFQVLNSEKDLLSEQNYQIILPFLSDSLFLEDLANTYVITHESYLFNYITMDSTYSTEPVYNPNTNALKEFLEDKQVGEPDQ